MSFLFAWRYFRAKKSANAVNIISWVSVSAIVVGTAALIIVLSVFNGLEDLVKSLYGSFYPDISIAPASGKLMAPTPEQLAMLGPANGVAAYSLTLEEKALLQYNNVQPVVLKGVDSNFSRVTGVARNISKGEFNLGDSEKPAVVLGLVIENSLGVASDRSIVPMSVYLFRNGQFRTDADMEAAVSTAQVAAAGSFSIQQDFDSKYAFTNLAFMQRMLSVSPDQCSGIDIRLTDPARAQEVKTALACRFGKNFLVQTRYEQNETLYAVMRHEKWFIYIALTLILIVAAFNIVGALTMLVLEKKKDVQVLKAMGADEAYIRRIFLQEGLLLGVVGGLGGMALALAACWAQVTFKLVPLRGDSFLIDYYPVKLLATDFILVFLTIFGVVMAASWYPARKASLEPMELKS